MDWNNLMTALGNTAPVVIVMAFGWFQAEKRAAASEQRAEGERAQRDEDNKRWADRFSEFAKALQSPGSNHTEVLTP